MKWRTTDTKIKLNRIFTCAMAVVCLCAALSTPPPTGTRQTRPQQTPDNRGGNITPLSHAQRPVCEYKVTGVNVQNGMQGNPITSLKLVSQDNREIKAFFNGTDSGLILGAELANVSLTVSKQDSVVFHILNGYSIIPLKGQAA